MGERGPGESALCRTKVGCSEVLSAIRDTHKSRAHVWCKDGSKLAHFDAMFVVGGVKLTEVKGRLLRFCAPCALVSTLF